MCDDVAVFLNVADDRSFLIWGNQWKRHFN